MTTQHEVLPAINRSTHHKNIPSFPNSVKLNRLGSVIPKVLKNGYFIIKFMWAVLPMKLSRSFVLTLKFMSNRWMLAP